MEPEKKQGTDPEGEQKKEAADGQGKETSGRHNWVTDLYDRANISVRQLNIMLVCLLGLIVALFVIFGR